MKKHFYMLLIALLLEPFLISTSLANSATNENYTNQAKTQMLRAAMSVSLDKLSSFRQGNRLAYTREKVDRDGEIESYRFTPTATSNGDWIRVDSDYSTNKHDTKVWENDIFFAPESFHLETAKLIDETDLVLFFDLPVSLGLTVDSDKIESNEKDKDTFRAIIELDKETQLVTSFKIYSIQEFSPQLGVTVESYQSLNKLKEIFKGGPLVISEQYESIRGDFGFLISIDEDTKIKNFDFAILEIDQ